MPSTGIENQPVPENEEIRKPKFEKGNTIYCPSDVHPNGQIVEWIVTDVNDDNGDVIAVVKGGQVYPSHYYPKKPLTIILEAQSQWEKSEINTKPLWTVSPEDQDCRSTESRPGNQTADLLKFNPKV